MGVKTGGGPVFRPIGAEFGGAVLAEVMDPTPLGPHFSLYLSLRPS